MTYHLDGLGTEPSARDRARQLYADGQASFNAQRFSDALQQFEQAYRTYSLPTVLVAIAESHLAMGHLRQAQRQAQRYLYADQGGSHASRARQIISVASAKTAAPGAPEVPSAVAEPMLPPMVDDVYRERSTVAVWVVTGVSVLGLVGAGWYFSRRRPKRVAANRRRTSRRR